MSAKEFDIKKSLETVESSSYFEAYKEIVKNIKSAIENGNIDKAIEQLNSSQLHLPTFFDSLAKTPKELQENYCLILAVYCSYRPDPSLVKTLIKQGAPLHFCYPSKSNKTLLHLVIDNFNFTKNAWDIANAILEQNISVNTEDNSAETPLSTLIDRAARFKIFDQECCEDDSYYFNFLELFQTLIKKGADINFLNKQGKTLLLSAVSWDDQSNDNVTLLIINEPSLDLHCHHQGRRALENAAQHCQFEVFEALVHRGALTCIKDDSLPTWTHFIQSVIANNFKEAQEWCNLASSCPSFVKADTVEKNWLRYSALEQVFYSLCKRNKHDYALLLSTFKPFHELLSTKGSYNTPLYNLHDSLKEQMSAPQIMQNDFELPLLQFQKLICLGANYNMGCRQSSILGHIAKEYMGFYLLDTLDKTPKEISENRHYQKFIADLSELRHHILLGHQFALGILTDFAGTQVKMEGMNDDSNSAVELKLNLLEYLSSSDEASIIIENELKEKLSGLKIQFESQVVTRIIDKIKDYASSFLDPQWLDSLQTNLEKQDLVLVPVTTKGEDTQFNYFAPFGIANKSIEVHAEAFALYWGMLYKLNRASHSGKHGILGYPIPKMDPETTATTLKEFHRSTYDASEILSSIEYDDALAHIFKIQEDEVPKHLPRKQQTVGNCSWATAKLYAYMMVYAACHRSLSVILVRHAVANKFDNTDTINILHQAKDIAHQIADLVYKCFSQWTRSASLKRYYGRHGFEWNDVKLNADTPKAQLSSNTFEALEHRIQGLYTFITYILEKQHNKTNSEKDQINACPDLTMVFSIFSKSLNKAFFWQLKQDKVKALTWLKHWSQKTKHFKPMVWNPFFSLLIKYDETPKLAMEGIQMLVNDPCWLRCDESGNTPLHYASKLGLLQVCRSMIENKEANKVDFCARNHEGWTALDLAVDGEHIDIILLLLEQAPELVSMKNLNGKREFSPILIAYLKNRMDIVNILNKKGARLSDLQMCQHNGYFAPPILHAFEAQSTPEVSQVLETNKEANTNKQASDPNKEEPDPNKTKSNSPPI